MCFGAVPVSYSAGDAAILRDSTLFANRGLHVGAGGRRKSKVELRVEGVGHGQAPPLRHPFNNKAAAFNPIVGDRSSV